MSIPKTSHLVERVAERLLRSGALDESAAQLLQPGPAPVVSDASAGPAALDPTSRSSLFAAPPDRSQPVASAVLNPAMASGTDLASPALAPPASAEAQPNRAQRLSKPESIADRTAGAVRGPALIDAVSLQRAGMIDWSRTRTRISEEFRLAQRQILRTAFGADAEAGFSNLLLVTSSRPGEGKSFMAINLAASIARQGDHDVLLVDADSKRDSICHNMGLGQARGLLDIAADPHLDPTLLIARTPIDRLSVLPVGRERERSAELFSTQDMTRLIQSLGRRYADRLLILDAPPCLSTSDPAVLAQVVGQVLFVVEADRTQRNEVEASLDLIQACPTITMILNKQKISSRYTFGAYSSYYSS